MKHNIALIKVKSAVANWEIAQQHLNYFDNLLFSYRVNQAFFVALFITDFYKIFGDSEGLPLFNSINEATRVNERWEKTPVIEYLSSYYIIIIQFP